MQQLSLMHLGADDLSQPFITRQAEHIVDMILFAPAHQLFTAEAGVALRTMLTRPALPQLRRDATDLFNETAAAS